jgi:hypothetical protein
LVSLRHIGLDSVSSPITKRVYNLGLDESRGFPRNPAPASTKATVSAWRVPLEARGLGAVSINVRITAVRKLAVEAADNALLAPELASGITRVKGVASKGVWSENWICMSLLWFHHSSVLAIMGFETAKSFRPIPLSADRRCRVDESTPTAGH